MRLAAVAVLSCAVLTAQSLPRPSVTATFHHFHFRVGDPAAAMNRAATALGGTRELLRGVGVGTRVGTVHAIFDRLDASAAAPRDVGAAYEAAVSWLRAHGVEILEDARSAASRAALAEMFHTELLDHVAFTASDLAAAVAVLRSQGAPPARETADGAVFESSSGLRIELLRDLDAPDAYWCPMHLDVRSSTPGTCPVCGMTLVPIPPPRPGEYRMDLAVSPGAAGRGISRLRITVREPGTDRRVASFATVHEKLLHLFVIDRQLQFFRHVHPAPQPDGTFDLRDALPPGEYVVFADFLPQGGVAQMLQRAIVTPGYNGPLFPAAPDLSHDTATERTVDGVRVKLEASGLKAGREAPLRFTLSSAVTGTPITDLEPFLGAPGHMLIVNADLTEADHVHPDEPATRGPSITFQPLPAAGGFYKLWLQFQRGGVVSTVPFVVAVEER